MSKTLKQLLFLFILMLPTIIFGQYGATIRSVRPGRTVGAYALGKNVFQVQTGYQFTMDKQNEERKRTSSQSGTVLRFGLAERVELNSVVNIAHYSSTINGDIYENNHQNIILGARLNLRVNKGWKPAIGLQARQVFWSRTRPTIVSLSPSNTVRLMTGNKLTNWLSFGTNIGINWKWPRTRFLYNVFYTTNFSAKVLPKLYVNAELYGIIDEKSTINYDVGIAYFFNKDFKIDVLGSWKPGVLEGQSEDMVWFINTGFSWRIDWRKEE